MTNTTQSLSFCAPVLEGFTLEMGGPLKGERALEIVKEHLGEGWSISPFGDQGTDFEVLGPRGAIPVDRAWELTYRFRTLPDVVFVEPLFALSMTRTGQTDGGPSGEGQPEQAPEQGIERGFLFDTVHLPESESKGWTPKQMRVFEAWAKYQTDVGGDPGKGIVVGIPDTGYHEHPEILANLKVSDGWDFVEDDSNAEDELMHGPLLFPGHGTAPGESVWVALVVGNPSVYDADRGSGTSFAAAAVAGIAALWLSYHGWENLIERYGAEKLSFIFNQVLGDSCEPFDGSEGEFGAGIVNADKVLSMELPDGVTRAIVPPAFGLQGHAPIDGGGLETFEHLFSGSPSVRAHAMGSHREMQSKAVLADGLTELLGVTRTQLSARLREVGQELAFRLAVNPELYEAFEQYLGAGMPVSSTPERADSVPARVGGKGARLREMILECGVSKTLRRSLGRGA